MRSLLLTPRERDLQRSFFFLLAKDKKETFTADDFFAYGLHRYFSDPAHMTGGFFQKLAAQGLIEEAGHIHSDMRIRASNHGRELKLWRKTPQKQATFNFAGK